MGLELKRVALDFVWPVNTIWSGYINPHDARQCDCPACEGSGSSPTARLLGAQWYGNAPFRPEDRGSTPFLPSHPAIVAQAERNVHHSPEYYRGQDAVEREAQRLAQHYNGCWCHHLDARDVAALVKVSRLLDFTHTFTREIGWLPKNPPVTPTPEEVNAWSLTGMAHDSINQWVVVCAECERLGVDAKCAACAGSGSVWESPEAKAEAEAWKPVEPPAGEGYQIWETVTDGSPISPVFATPEELAHYMHLAGKLPESTESGTYETWMAFILGPGWAPTLRAESGKVSAGPDAAFSSEAPGGQQPADGSAEVRRAPR